MDQMLLNLVLALAVNELFHNFAEVKNMREKVNRLQCYMQNKPYKEIPLNIDTRAKSYALSFSIFLVVVSLGFGFFTWLDLNSDVALKLIAGLLIVTYALTAITVDQFHVEIEKVTKPFKKKKTTK
jgi:hypothetical protein